MLDEAQPICTEQEEYEGCRTSVLMASKLGQLKKKME